MWALIPGRSLDELFLRAWPLPGQKRAAFGFWPLREVVAHAHPNTARAGDLRKFGSRNLPMTFSGKF
jgi:hypothetical protein